MNTQLLKLKHLRKFQQRETNLLRLGYPYDPKPQNMVEKMEKYAEVNPLLKRPQTTFDGMKPAHKTFTSGLPNEIIQETISYQSSNGSKEVEPGQHIMISPTSENLSPVSSRISHREQVQMFSNTKSPRTQHKNNTLRIYESKMRKLRKQDNALNEKIQQFLQDEEPEEMKKAKEEERERLEREIKRAENLDLRNNPNNLPTELIRGIKQHLKLLKYRNMKAGEVDAQKG